LQYPFLVVASNTTISLPVTYLSEARVVRNALLARVESPRLCQKLRAFNFVEQSTNLKYLALLIECISVENARREVELTASKLAGSEDCEN
jgi:hypothetical protein